MSLEYTEQNALEDAHAKGKREGFLEGLQEAQRLIQLAIEEEEKGVKK